MGARDERVRGGCDESSPRLANDVSTWQPNSGSGYEAPDTTALIDHAVGDDFTIIRIPEELEFEDGTLEFLEEFGFTPGRHGSVQSTTHDGGLVVDLDGTTVEGMRSSANEFSSPITNDYAQLTHLSCYRDCPMLAACGSTYIDESLGESSTTVVETVDVTEMPDRTFEHLDVIDQSLNDLSDAIVENDGSADVMLATILESWGSARRRSRLTLLTVTSALRVWSSPGFG